MSISRGIKKLVRYTVVFCLGFCARCSLETKTIKLSEISKLEKTVLEQKYEVLENNYETALSYKKREEELYNR